MPRIKIIEREKIMSKIDEFIDFCNKKHNNKYDYSRVSFRTQAEKIEIICSEHGIFTQIASQHKIYGCKKCGNKLKNQSKRITVDYFIEKCSIRYKNKYDYHLINKIDGVHDKVKIICPQHGVFEQQVETHMNSKIGCMQCYNDVRGEMNILSNDVVINNLKIKHPEYDYSKVNYIGNQIKIDIICQKHGVFRSLYHNLLNGSKCPKCRESKGETAIRLFLERNNIQYIKEYYFNEQTGRKDSNIFDFYLPDKNIFIEYNGIQHYKSVDFFGGDEALTKQRYKDVSKLFITSFEFGGELIEVPFYYLSNIDEYLEYKLCKKE